MRIIYFLCLFALCSCWGTRNYKEEYLYNKVGFIPSRRPVITNRESHKINSIAPTINYYSGYNVPENNSGVGGSRFYNDPYSIPASQIPQSYQGNYNNYKVYDADRFYVPPNSYRYIEKP